MSLAERLKEVIDNQQVTNYQLSKETGVAQSSIGRILKGGQANRSTLVALSDFLGINVDWLMTGKTEDNDEINFRVKKIVKWLIGNDKVKNQEDLAYKLGYTSKSSFSQILNGKVKLPDNFIDRLVELDSRVNKKWILTGEGEMQTVNIKNESSTIHQITFDNYMEVKYLPVVAQAGYLNGYYDINNHINELDTMLVPREFEKGSYLVVEISGDSMNDGTNRAICDGDRLLLKELDKSHWKDKLHFRQHLFVIMSGEGIVCKQIIEHNTENHEIKCHSWNDGYPDYNISLNEVYKLFYVKKIVERRIKF